MWAANGYEEETWKELAKRIGVAHAENDCSEPTIESLEYFNDYRNGEVSDAALKRFQTAVEDAYYGELEAIADATDYYKETQPNSYL